MIEDRLIELAKKADAAMGGVKWYLLDDGSLIFPVNNESKQMIAGASPEVILALSNVVKAARQQGEAYEATWDHGLEVDPRIQALLNAVRVTYDSLSALDALKEEK